jgi:hypothetical protein
MPETLLAAGPGPGGQGQVAAGALAEELSDIREISLPEHWPPLQDDWGAERASGYRRDAPLDCGAAFPRQFGILLVEALAGARPVRQLMPWLSSRGGAQLRRLLPLFAGGPQPRVLRLLTASPAPDVVEMTIVVETGQRARALAIRLERAKPREATGLRETTGHRESTGLPEATRLRASTGLLETTVRRGKPAAQWLCTDIEAA